MVPKAERQNLGWHGPLVPWWHGGMVARGHGAMVPNPLLVPWSHGAKSSVLGGRAWGLKAGTLLPTPPYDLFSSLECANRTMDASNGCQGPL